MAQNSCNYENSGQVRRVHLQNETNIKSNLIKVSLKFLSKL